MKHFSIRELTASAVARRRGYDNTPPEDVRRNLVALTDNVLDPLREAYGKPIFVTSGYRCPRLNKAVGGAKGSQHLTGQAADIRSASDEPWENKLLFDLRQSLGLPFDQLIDEHGFDWIHVSFGPRHRRQVLHVR